MEEKKWVMPEWMKPLIWFMQDGFGDALIPADVAEIMNLGSTYHGEAVRLQVQLLEALHGAGLLRDARYWKQYHDMVMQVGKVEEGDQLYSVLGRKVEVKEGNRGVSTVTDLSAGEAMQRFPHFAEIIQAVICHPDYWLVASTGDDEGGATITINTARG